MRSLQCTYGAVACDALSSVHAAVKGARGAWIFTDGFPVGEVKELLLSEARIFELARQIDTVRDYFLEQHGLLSQEKVCI